MRIDLRRILPLALVGVLLAGCLDDDPTKTTAPAGGQTAVLILDYKTTEFLGGAVLDAPDCPDCDASVLPFDVHHVLPIDFGSVAFTYTATGDTVFAGSIVWHGPGAMTHPAKLDDPASFERLRCLADEPDKVEFFHPGDTVEPDVMAAAFPGLWRRVADRELLHRFMARDDVRAGLYLYPPTVGGLDEDAARWVMFLHSDAGLGEPGRGCGD
jgi:hypothetical protein